MPPPHHIILVPTCHLHDSKLSPLLESLITSPWSIPLCSTPLLPQGWRRRCCHPVVIPPTAHISTLPPPPPPPHHISPNMPSARQQALSAPRITHHLTLEHTTLPRSCPRVGVADVAIPSSFLLPPILAHCHHHHHHHIIILVPTCHLHDSKLSSLLKSLTISPWSIPLYPTNFLPQGWRHRCCHHVIIASYRPHLHSVIITHHILDQILVPTCHLHYNSPSSLLKLLIMSPGSMPPYPVPRDN